MGAAAHDISPELVLVCPELREHALELLPALDPDALFELSPRPATRPVELAPAPEPPALEPEPDKPRLVLVEQPPRRALPLAFAAYVAEALVFGALRGAALIAVIATASFLLAR